MGDPKKLKKKYFTPRHPWNKTNIETEGVIKKEYGLKNKKEIFIASSFLKKYKDIAKKLIATKTVQAEKEKAQILTKLQLLGLLPTGADLDQILGLELKQLMERRLQSLVFRKGLAKTMNQARQFIIHRHIKIGEQEIARPSYIVSLEEENSISFKDNSTLFDENHPERVREKEVKDVKEEIKAVRDKIDEKKSGRKKKEVDPAAPAEPIKAEEVLTK